MTEQTPLPDPAMFQDRSCRGMDQDLFFPTTDADAAVVRAICGSCPRLVECARWAVPQALEGRLAWAVVAGVRMPPAYGRSSGPRIDRREAAAIELAEVAAAAMARETVLEGVA